MAAIRLELDAAASVAKAQLNALNAEVRRLASEIASASGAANDNLVASLKNAAAGAASAKRELASLTKAKSDIGGLVESTGKASAGFKQMATSAADAAYNFGPWTGQHTDLAKAAIIGVADALGVAALAFGAIGAAAAVAMAGVGAAAIHMGETAEKASSQFDLEGASLTRLQAVGLVTGQTY